MNDIYRIHTAKTEFREGYNTRDADRILAVIADGFTDLSEGASSKFGDAARSRLRTQATDLFAGHIVKLNVIGIDVVVLGETAYAFGWHEWIMRPKEGGEVVRKRQRYCELWRKNGAGAWQIVLLINNADVAEQFAGQVPRWFVSEARANQLPQRSE